jgi:hypothetical protein
MITKHKLTHQLSGMLTATVIATFSSSAIATDDGARTYWKQRDGTNVVSFQSMNLNMQASESQQFAPGQYIYPGADTEANIIIGTWAHHLTVLDRPSILAFNAVAGSIDVDIKTDTLPEGFGGKLNQSSSGFADPSVQLDVNLFGTSPLKSTVDLLNNEPTWTVDAAVMLSFPIGEYDDTKLVNMGFNRWFGRIAFPVKYHFGVFAPGYMGSFEITPAVLVFADNDEFLGQTLENDPMLQLEAHLTQDFTRTFFGSIDMLYRSGFQSEVNGVKAGEEIDLGNLGFTLNFQASDNIFIRTSYSSNVFGDKDIDSSMIRLQFVYGWHQLTQNAKKLSGH